MAVAPPQPGGVPVRAPNVRAGPGPVLADRVWQAPLVGVAAAVTVGVVADHLASVPLGFSVAAVLASLAAWAVTQAGHTGRTSAAFLLCGLAAVGSGYHHAYLHVYPVSDIGNFAASEPRPVRLRGVLAEEPAFSPAPPDETLRSIPQGEHTGAVLRVTGTKQADEWQAATGRARLVVPGRLSGLHAGDEVEVVGRLVAPAAPANPGEAAYGDFLRDRRIRALVVVRKTADGVTPLRTGWVWSPAGWLAAVRGWARGVLEERMGNHAGVAAALLLGDSSAMSEADWEKYMRTGVVHVLAISGQHLVVLGGFTWFVLRLAGVPRRRGACMVAALLFAYALLTGGQPPIMRSAVTVAVLCGAIVLRRVAWPANSLALAWLVVVAANPTDVFAAGCQLSFLAVALLYWGASRWLRREEDPLDRLVEQSRPAWQRFLRRIVKAVGSAYLLNLLVWLAVSPLVAARFHLVSPVANPLGPPVVLLSSVALLSGLLLLLSAATLWPLAAVFAWVTEVSLAGCEWLVRLGEGWTPGHWYVPDVPAWWLCTFYGGFLAVLTVPWFRRNWRWMALTGSAWLVFGLALPWFRHTPGELRCTFLAVGHGGCTVIETPDGRVLLYDAGAITGPDVTRRQIAPFLWSRGVGRIDEVFLSHADADHFNGLPALFERFAVGRVTCTPTFSEKPTGQVSRTLEAFARQRVPVRTVSAGQRLTAGAVVLDVLHPPAEGPPGNENTRSMVLAVRYAGRSILLTGDLEGLGLQRVVRLHPGPVDVLMAPHHGSRAGNKDERTGRRQLVEGTRPALVVACQGPPQWPPRGADPYASGEAEFLGTWPHGAITIRVKGGAMEVETYRTGRQTRLPERKGSDRV